MEINNVLAQLLTLNRQLWEQKLFLQQTILLKDGPLIIEVTDSVVKLEKQVQILKQRLLHTKGDRESLQHAYLFYSDFDERRAEDSDDDIHKTMEIIALWIIGHKHGQADRSQKIARIVRRLFTDYIDSYTLWCSYARKRQMLDFGEASRLMEDIRHMETQLSTIVVTRGKEELKRLYQCLILWQLEEKSIDVVRALVSAQHILVNAVAGELTEETQK